MPSKAYRRWTGARATALDEIAQAHIAIGGTGPGRRYATQQINQAYAVLLASQFQGFCRDLHTECIDHLVTAIAFRPLQYALVAEFTWGRQLDRGNAQTGNIGADFRRLGLDFWTEVDRCHTRAGAWKGLLDELNTWRNAIAHQDFNPAKLGGTTTLRLARVRRWRAVCHRLARTFDEVMRHYLEGLRGVSPW